MARSRKQLEASLSPKKKLAALLMVERDLSDDKEKKGKSTEDIAQEVGVSRMQLYRYRQEPEFIEYMQLLAMDFLASKQSEVFDELMGSIKRSKSVRAMELYFKILGLLKTTNIVEINETQKTDEDIKKDIEELENLLNDKED